MFLTLKRRVGTGITLSYLIALSLVIGIGILAIVRLDQISATVNDLTDNLAVDRALSDDIINQVLLTRFYANKYVRTQDQADVDHFADEFDKLEAFLIQADRQITSPERVEMINRIEPAVREYGDTFQKVARLIRKHQRVHSEVLDVQELVIESDLTALRVHTLSLNNPGLFLAFANAQRAFQVMNLNAVKYLEEGDERYAVQFETGYQQAQAAFSSLEATLQDPARHQNAADAKAATAAYYEGFQTIHADYVELKDLFKAKLDVLEPEISNTASEIAASVEREFETQNEFSQVLISQTRLVLLVTTTIAILAGLGLGITINRRSAERKRAMVEIRAEKEKSETILHNVGDAIVMTDLDRRAHYVNPAFTAMTGYTAQEVIGLPVDFVFAEAQQAMRTALEKGKVWRGETSGRRKDGLYYDVALTVAPIRDADGNLAGYVSSHQDISQRKELERARSQFMTNVSHELRTPVSNVKIYTHLLQRGQRAEKAKHYFQVLVEQTGLLEALIQDILEITSLDSGQVLVAWESVSLSTVVADAVKRYQKRAEASGLTLEVMPIPTDLPVVRGDASRLLQALSEVVENAVTFTPSGGRVAIEAEVVEEEGECWVTIAVRDTGPGISQEEQERVFDRFFRGSLAESGHIPGTGLGLSIVQEILQAHGGRVTVESPPLPSTSLRTGTGGTEGGPGSIFTLWLRGVPSGGSE